MIRHFVDEASRKELRKVDGLRPLVALLYSQSPIVQQKAAGLFAYFSHMLFNFVCADVLWVCFALLAQAAF
jgi:hypothetical protein